MKILGYIGVAVVAGLLVLGGSFISRPVNPVINNVGGVDTQSPWTCQGDLCTWVTAADFKDATTTPISVRNPWAATSTVSLVQVWGTWGTTTGAIYVGTSTLSSITASTSINASLINPIGTPAPIATSTKFFIQNATIGWGIESVYANSAEKQSIVVGPTEYVLGYASSTYTAAGVSVKAGGGFTDTNNTFTGKYLIRWTRLR